MARHDALDHFRGMMTEGEFPDLSDFYRRPPWQALAACKGLDVGAFVIRRGETTEAARAVCARCCVSEACLSYALADDTPEELWAGTTRRERRAMRRLPA